MSRLRTYAPLVEDIPFVLIDLPRSRKDRACDPVVVKAKFRDLRSDPFPFFQRRQKLEISLNQADQPVIKVCERAEPDASRK